MNHRKALKILTAVGFMVVASLAPLYYQTSQVPELGLESGRLRPLSSKPNGVSTYAQDPAKRVDPWPFKDSLDETRESVLAAVRAYGGCELKESSEHYLRFVFVTPLMRFRDDAEFYFDEKSQLVHFRSQSRAGYSDMGLNRKRFQELTASYRSD